MIKLPSKHQIDEEVEFLPMYRHQKELGISEQIYTGRIVGIRFTKAKVFYDIVCDYWGRIFDGVESTKVAPSPLFPSSQPLIEVNNTVSTENQIVTQ